MKTSVALCTYNGSRFLEQQLDSILNQTMQVDEIIVCDDRSTDDTLNILTRYKAKFSKIHVFKNESTLGSVKNFEKALSLCNGEFIFLSDQDDLWVATKVEDFIDYFTKHNEFAVLASSGFGIDENNNTISSPSVWDIPDLLEILKIEYNYFTLITQLVNVATGATMCLKKSFLNEVLPFPVSEWFHHDEWIATISSSMQKFAFLRDKKIYYRVHPNQQVGGVFMNINDEKHTHFIEMFGPLNRKFKFETYKKTLNNLTVCYKKNFLLYRLTKNDVFIENQKAIELKFQKTKRSMQQHYPLSALITNTLDRILKKRQLTC